jgi:hypothetical protein
MWSGKSIFAFGARLSNKRLKLAVAHKYGGIVLPRLLAFVSAAPTPCARGRFARSLSAIC